MRALWHFLLYFLFVSLWIGAAIVIAFITGHIIPATLLMIAISLALSIPYKNLKTRIDNKMDIVERQVEREQTEDFVAYETDPVTGMTYAKAYKRHLLETQKASELLPSSDALTIAMEIASSFKQSMARLDFRATYKSHFIRFKRENPDLQLEACKERLQKGIENAFEQGDYWPRIEEQLEEQLLYGLINHAVDINPPHIKLIEYGFFLRDTPVAEATLAQNYQPGILLNEPAILPAAKGNYLPMTSHRFMLYDLPYLEDAQAYTQLPDTALLSPGFYYVADQYTYQDKTMTLLIFITNAKGISEIDIREHGFNINTEVIYKARAHFKASFKLGTPEAFASEQWQAMMKPMVGDLG